MQKTISLLQHASDIRCNVVTAATAVTRLFLNPNPAPTNPDGGNLSTTIAAGLNLSNDTTLRPSAVFRQKRIDL